MEVLAKIIIQILTRTVMKYHVSVDCQESYIFPRDYVFPKCAALRENIVPRETITILALPTRDISTVPVDICYITWSKLMISSKYFVLMTNTKFGNKTLFTRRISFWVSFLIWNWCYCCCRLYFIYWTVIFLWLRHFGCYNSVFDRLSMRA